MSYKTCKVKNISGATKTWCGQEIVNNGEVLIEDVYRVKWATDDEVLQSISSEDLQVGNGDTYFTAINEQLNYLKEDVPIEATIEYTSRYSMKAIAKHAQCAINQSTNIDIKLENFTGNHTLINIYGVGSCLVTI